MNQNWHYIFPKKLLLRAYMYFEALIVNNKSKLQQQMKISLCVLIGTLSVRVKTNPQHVKYRYHTQRLATTETTKQHGN